MGKRGPKPKDPSRTDYNYNSDGTKRNHAANLGKRMDQRRVDRAEELFSGLGPEGVPLPYRKIVTILSTEFAVSESQAKNYLKVAKERLAERFASFDPDSTIEQTDMMFLDAFGVAKGKQDAHAMVAAAHRRAELRGVFRQNVSAQLEVKGLGDLFGEQFGKQAPPGTFESKSPPKRSEDDENYEE